MGVSFWFRLFSSKTDDVIQVQRAGGITKIIMNRPEKMNALSDEMYQKFTAAMKEASKDPNSKITVIAGQFSLFIN